jgi:hypothetical protein
MTLLLFVIMCLFLLGAIGWAVITINHRSEQWSSWDD